MSQDILNQVADLNPRFFLTTTQFIKLRKRLRCFTPGVLNLYSLIYPLANFKSKIDPPKFFYIFTSTNAYNESRD